MRICTRKRVIRVWGVMEIRDRETETGSMKGVRINEWIRIFLFTALLSVNSAQAGNCTIMRRTPVAQNLISILLLGNELFEAIVITSLN